VSGADAGGSCHGGRLISSNRGGKCADAVLAALAIPDVTLGAMELMLVNLAMAEGWFLLTEVVSVLLLFLVLLPSPMLTLGAMELMLVNLAVAEGWFLPKGLESVVYVDGCWGCPNLLQTQKRAECWAVFWWSDAARPQPKQPVAHFCCFAAFLHKGEEALFLIGWDLVFGDVTCDSCAVVIAVALDVPPCAHFHLSFPARPVLWELFAEWLLPEFACGHCKIFVLFQILNIAITIVALTLLLVAATSFSYISCCGVLGFLNGCGFEWILDLLERCRQVHLEGTIEYLVK
jgi:hypothetical protein